MILKILKLYLENYAGFPSFEVDFTEKTIVSGKNGLGKTTIANAIFSTLFMGKNMDGTKADRHRPHDIKGVDLNMDPVKAGIVIEVDGQKHTITRIESQKWVKHRGNLEPVFEGNTTSYVVDDLSISESQYKKWLDNMGISEKEFKSVTTAKDLLNMKVNDRRNKLIEMFGDISSDYDIAAQNDTYEKLVDYLKTYTIDEVINNHKNALKQCEQTLKDLPLRIMERKGMLVDIDDSVLKAEKERIENAIEQVKSDKQALLNKGTSAITFKINNLNLEISRRENKVQSDYYQQNSLLQLQLQEASKYLSELREDAEKSKVKYKTNHERLNELKEELNNAQNEYKEVVSSEFDESTAICPTCGRKYEPDMLEEVKNNFEKQKKEKLDILNVKGENAGQKYISTKNEIAQIIDDAKILQGKIENHQTIVENIKKRIEELGTIENFVASDEVLNSLKNDLLDLNNKIDNVETENVNTGELDTKLANLETELASVNNKLSQAFYNKQNEEIIADYERQINEARIRGAELQAILDLSSDFKNAKLKLVENRINSAFKLVKWVMFENQINGGIADVCTPTVNGSIVGNELNTSMSVLAEIDICNAFQDKLNLKAPIIVDNAEQLDSESLSKINSDTQLILFRVTDDKQLSIQNN